MIQYGGAIAHIVGIEFNNYSGDPGLLMLAPEGKVKDPLLWWKANEFRFPILAKLARRTLCVPATSAPSERVFSAAGLTIANNRARLNGDLAAAQIFLSL